MDTCLTPSKIDKQKLEDQKIISQMNGRLLKREIFGSTHLCKAIECGMPTANRALAQCGEAVVAQGITDARWLRLPFQSKIGILCLRLGCAFGL
jgi:hypothetical protein